MAVDPQLLEQALRTPESQDVTMSPIVRTVFLADPANAADLVPQLGRPDLLMSRNARRVLCAFEADAASPLLAALALVAEPRIRADGIGVLWALLSVEDRRTVRETLDASTPELAVLMADNRSVPSELPEYVERDFVGRVCDHAYVVVRELLDPEFDQSDFRGADDEGRDRRIRQWQSQRPGGVV